MSTTKPSDDTTKTGLRYGDHSTRTKDGEVEINFGDGRRLWNPQKASKELGRPRQALQVLERQGLPHIRVGARKFYDPAQIFEFFKKHEQTAPPIHQPKRRRGR